MDILTRNLANLFWLEKFTVFKPENLRPLTGIDKNLMSWGNYSIGQNLYPQLFEAFIKYSPTANFILNKLLRYAFGNIPKNIKCINTTFGGGFSDTIMSQILRAGRDSFLFNGAFAVWCGYDKNGHVNEFRTIPISRLRYVSCETINNFYVSRETTNYDNDEDSAGNVSHETSLTDKEFLIGIVDDETATTYTQLYFQFEPEKINLQTNNFNEIKEINPKIGVGQILFYNPTPQSEIYPDCVFDSSLPLLLTDAGVDTLTMSYLGNSDILKTYKLNTGGGGADMANNSQTIKNVWGGYDTGGAGFSTIPQNSSDFYQTGVKSAGQSESVNLSVTKIQDAIYNADFPDFTDELNKIDERTGRRMCAALGIPYEIIFKMESGVINQDNRAALIGELNIQLEDVRNTFEQIFNKILSFSTSSLRINILPFGGGMGDVKSASDNVTE